MSHSPATVRQFYFVMELTTQTAAWPLYGPPDVEQGCSEHRTHELSGQCIYRESCPRAHFYPMIYVYYKRAVECL